MKPVKILLGAATETPLPALLAQCAAMPAWKPFDARAVAFVSRFSQRLLTSPGVRRYPEMAALGHWFRAAALRDFAKSRPEDGEAAITLGRGLVFHLAPANVDSVFMYSWLISLLSGNTNIVRVSQKPSEQLAFLIELLQATLDDPAGAPAAGRIVLLTYAHDDAVTAAISQHCMMRVVWGGDATVATIRAVPLRPTATEMCFPDRFSAAAIAAQAVLDATPDQLARLAHGFYNDAFWFAQQACSSPRMLAWVGTPAQCTGARARFWAAVDAELSRQRPDNTEAMSMARLAAAFEYAAAKLAHPEAPALSGSFPLRLMLEQPLNAGAKERHCGNGIFLEQEIPMLSALAGQLSDKEQTLAVYGFDRAELVTLVEALPPRALDRITPIGEALAFAPVWDGQDLVTAFTRRISLPRSAALHA